MGRYRFVDPDVVRLEISADDWIEVKKRLSAGEKRKMQAAGVIAKRSADDPQVNLEVDMTRLGFARIEAYLVDWSFVNAKGKQIDVTREAIQNLDDETIAEIDAALDAHLEALEQEKKDQTGKPTLTVVSASAE